MKQLIIFIEVLVIFFGCSSGPALREADNGFKYYVMYPDECDQYIFLTKYSKMYKHYPQLNTIKPTDLLCLNKKERSVTIYKPLNPNQIVATKESFTKNLEYKTWASLQKIYLPKPKPRRYNFNLGSVE